MNRRARFAVVLVAVAVGASPAFAEKPPSQPGKSAEHEPAGAGQAGKPPDHAGKSAAHEPRGAGQPGPRASHAAKAKAYGHYCQNQSKRHIAGQKGTPFSQCVTAMAKLATGQMSSPWAACLALSRKHVPGATGIPFTNCVLAGRKLLNDQHKP